MTKVLLAIGILLMSAPQTLKYAGKAGDSAPMQGGFTLTLNVTGPPTLTRQLRASNIILGIQELRVDGAGQRVINDVSSEGLGVQITFDRARVTGTYNSKPFQYEFEKGKAVNVAEDQLQQIAWALGMGGRVFRVASKGEYLTGDENEDASGEAMGLIIDSPVRLPAEGVEAGHEWTTEWTGTRRHRENGGLFKYTQQAKLEQVVNGRARIIFTLNGTLQIPPEKNTQREETTMESKGSIVLDLQTGLPVSKESTGTITTDLKAASLKIVRGIASRYDAK